MRRAAPAHHRRAGLPVWHDRRVAESSDDLAARVDPEDATDTGMRPRSWGPPAPLPPAQVIEPEQPRRIRRPNDAFRLVGWTLVTGLLLVAGDVALGTTTGLEEDLTSAITTLPDLIITILAFASSLLLLLLPPLILADLALRRRWRTIWVASAAGITGWLISYAFSILGPEFLSATLLGRAHHRQQPRFTQRNRLPDVDRRGGAGVRRRSAWPAPTVVHGVGIGDRLHHLASLRSVRYAPGPCSERCWWTCRRTRLSLWGWHRQSQTERSRGGGRPEPGRRSAFVPEMGSRKRRRTAVRRHDLGRTCT